MDEAFKKKLISNLNSKGILKSDSNHNLSVSRNEIKIQKENGEVVSLFIKFGTGGESSAKIELLEYEALGLQHLANACSIIKVPQVYFVGSLKSQNCIIMDKIPFGHEDCSAELGKGLAEMHLHPPQHSFFGFPLDGCCGNCPQLNNVECRKLNWVEFWKEFRLGKQLEMLQENCPDEQVIIQKGAELMKRLPELFSMLRVEDIPLSLLHGDLWNGNYKSDIKGNPVIFDPAAYYGHSEADLGIARMFGGFSNYFWSEYHKKIPKEKGYERRALLYELHHHLNHMNIFGKGYRSGVINLMKEILK